MRYTNLLLTLTLQGPGKSWNLLGNDVDKAHLLGVIATLTEAGGFPKWDADEAATQYADFMGSVAVKCHAEVHNLILMLEELDSFYSHMADPVISYTKSQQDPGKNASFVLEKTWNFL